MLKWRIATNALIAVVMLAGTSLLGWRAYDGIRKTHAAIAPEVTRAASETQRQFACLEEAFRSTVPPGTKVFLAIDDPLWHQRTAVAAFPDRPVTNSPDRARLVVKLRTPSSPNPCEGDFFEIGRAGA